MTQVTEAMIEAGRRAYCEAFSGSTDELIAAIYLAMSSSAPSSGGLASDLLALPVRTEIVNVDTGETGAQTVEVPLALRDKIVASLTPPPVTDEVERVARAIHVARFARPGHERQPEPMNLTDEEYCNRLARAAIASLTRSEGVERGKDVIATAIAHVLVMDTPRQNDPRRRFTYAQMETAIRFALKEGASREG